jgi:hypothetical protein
MQRRALGVLAPVTGGFVDDLFPSRLAAAAEPGDPDSLRQAPVGRAAKFFNLLNLL